MWPKKIKRDYIYIYTYIYVYIVYVYMYVCVCVCVCVYICIGYTDTAFSDPKSDHRLHIFAAKAWAKHLDILCRMQIWHAEEINHLMLL